MGRLVVSQMCYSVTLCQKVKKKLSKSWPKRKKVVKKVLYRPSADSFAVGRRQKRQRWFFNLGGFIHDSKENCTLVI
jgi:hypothetical protein